MIVGENRWASSPPDLFYVGGNIMKLVATQRAVENRECGVQVDAPRFPFNKRVSKLGEKNNTCAPSAFALTSNARG